MELNTGEKIHHPQPLKQNQLRKLNKAVSRKVKGSNNWWRAVRDLARLHVKIANQRLDWQWKRATDLCRRFDTIVTETLNLDAMKRLWGRKVSDLAFGQFVRILEFKCFKHNRLNLFFPIGRTHARRSFVAQTFQFAPLKILKIPKSNKSFSFRQWTLWFTSRSGCQCCFRAWVPSRRKRSQAQPKRFWVP